MLLEQQIIFRPKKLPQQYVFKGRFPLTEYFFDFNIEGNSFQINVVHVQTVQPKGIVFFLHGTLNHIQYHLPKTDLFIENGYDVVMMDYPKYGKSKGVLTAPLLYKVVESTFIKVRDLLPPTTAWIIAGRSLGTALASNLATKISAMALILISPYYSMPDLFQHKVKLFTFNRLHFKLENFLYLPKVPCKSYILHGTKDKLIPISIAEKLIPFLKSPAHFFAIEYADHFNIHEMEAYKEKIRLILG
ncbi:MAG: alpha/beta hydrolase [Chitinophagales bacterium]